MPNQSYLAKFPDLIQARYAIQRNATSLGDIQAWIKENSWFFAAATLYRHERAWSDNRKKLFFRAHKAFAFDEFTIVSAGNGLRTLNGFHDTNLHYRYAKKHVRDEVDIQDGLELLCLTGGGGGNFDGDFVRGMRAVKVKAQDWFYLAEPCILASIGSSVWNAERMGATRWYPDVEFENLNTLHCELGLGRSIAVQEAKARLDGTRVSAADLPELPDFT